MEDNNGNSKQTAKKTVKSAVDVTKKIGKALIKLTFFVIKHPIITFAIIATIIFIVAFSPDVKKKDTKKMTSVGENSINGVLGLNDISELVTINGTPEEGYSLAFVDDIDMKLEEVLESSKKYKQGGITEPSILKQYIKAELVTQLPYLGQGVESSKLPDLNGVDIIEEPEENSNTLNSMEGIIMLGDSFTARLHASGLLEDGCEYYCKDNVSPQYWIDHFDELPNTANGVCVLLGVNNPYEIKNMKNLIDKLVNKYPGKPIYVQKVFPLGKKYKANDRDTIQAQIDKYNSEIQSYCKNKENIYWIDTTGGYVDEFGYLITNDTEGIHIDENNQSMFVTNIKNNILKGYGSSSSSSDELQGSTPEEAIWGFLIGQGFSEEAAAGIMGNWKAESGFRPNAVQGDSTRSDRDQYDEEMTNKFEAMSEIEFSNDTTGGGGYGIAQWTTPNRKEDLHLFAKEQGKGLDDLKMQLDYFIWECGERYQSILEDDFKKTSGGEEAAMQAAIDFHDVYEGSNDSDDAIKANRGGPAKEIYNTYHGTIPSGTYSASSSKKGMAVTDRDVSQEDTFQPAVKLKRVIPDKTIGELSEVNGNVIEMTYVPQGVFNAYINQQNSNVLEVFTINNNREIVFAKWSYSSDSGVKYSKASSVDIATVMEKYSMPYDYLMIFNIYGRDVEFCLDLAELAINSEYVIAIQDQVTTTKIVTDQTETITTTLTEEAYEAIVSEEVNNRLNNLIGYSNGNNNGFESIDSNATSSNGRFAYASILVSDNI